MRDRRQLCQPSRCWYHDEPWCGECISDPREEQEWADLMWERFQEFYLPGVSSRQGGDPISRFQVDPKGLDADLSAADPGYDPNGEWE